MKEKDFIKIVARNTEGVTQKQTHAVIKNMVKILQSELARGETITIVGMGKFSVKQRNDFEYVDPRTGFREKQVHSKMVSFAASRILKREVKR